MKSSLPSTRDIEVLVSFLPRLYPDEVLGGPGAGAERDGEVDPSTRPPPEYEQIVVEFFRLASAACWCDYHYQPQKAGRMLSDSRLIETASLTQIRTMLTFCVRGERFAEGHWLAMVEDGHILRLLKRLSELRDCQDERYEE